MNSYYEEQLKTAAYGMKIAASYASYSEKEGTNKRIQSRITKLLHKIQLTKTKDKRKVLSQIYRILEKINNKEKSLMTFEVERNIEKQYGKYLDGHTIHSIAKAVADDALGAITQYALQYINALESIEEEKQREKESKEETKSYSDSTNNYSSHTTYSSRSTYSYDEPRKTTATYYSPEYSKEKIAELLDPKKEYSYSDKETLEKLLRSCAKMDKMEESTYVYDAFYGREEIDKLYRFFKLTDKKGKKHGAKSEYIKIVEMAMLAPDIIFNDMMGYKGLKRNSLLNLINSFKPHSALTRYEGARIRWLKKYKHLNRKNKQKVNYEAESQDEYRKMFNIFGKTGADIATIEDIKRVVNKKVREHLRKDGPFNHIARGPRNEFDPAYRHKFIGMVQYMSIEEIASLYHSLVHDYTTTYYKYSRSNTDEEKNNALANLEEQVANFQFLCASVISGRLTDEIKNTNNKKEVEQSEKDIISICREILGEEPKLDIYSAKSKFVSPDYSKKRIASTKAVAEATRRYYGMKKFNRTVAILSKRKLERLKNKELLSERQIEQVDNMFRR